MAFDRGQPTFLYAAEKNSLFMKLLENSIASTILAEASAACIKDPFGFISHLPGAVAAMTFKDCHGPSQILHQQSAAWTSMHRQKSSMLRGKTG